MPDVSIRLPVRLTRKHLRVVRKYFENTDRLSPQDWTIALESFHLLGSATVILAQQPLTFHQVYDRYIDQVYADDFSKRLLELENHGTKAEALQQEYAFAILEMLEQNSLYHEEVEDSEYLAAYCLYWWTAFGKGYRFELTICRDLRESGITFITHDISNREERRSPYDLIVSQQWGDIKTTAYFMYNAAMLPLSCDFYITRLYHTRQRRYLNIVILTEAAWHKLNGEVPMADLDTAADFFPDPVQIPFSGQNLVNAPYEIWKVKVKKRQQEEK
jgi:hypothetical protein